MMFQRSVRTALRSLAVTSCISLLCATSAWADAKPFSAVADISVGKVNRLVARGKAFSKSGTIKSESLDIPVNGEVVTLSLSPHDIRSDDYAVSVTDKNGTRDVANGDQIFLFQGKPKNGIAGDFARVTVSRPRQKQPFNLSGLIQYKGKYYKFAPVTQTKRSQASVEIAEVNVKEIAGGESKIPGSCSDGATESAASDITSLARAAANASGQLPGRDFAVELKIATDMDYNLTTSSFGGDESAARAAILNHINQVDAIYRRDLGITLTVSYQHFWYTTSTDEKKYPFAKIRDAGALSHFSSYWESHLAPGRTFAFAYGYSSGNPTGHGGTAWFDGVCRGYSRYGMGTSTLGRGYYEGTGTFAHELGHNLGVPGTHASCSGGIMCRNGGKQFFSKANMDSIWSALGNRPTTGCYSLRPDLPRANQTVADPEFEATDNGPIGSIKIKWQPWPTGKVPVRISLYRSTYESQSFCQGTPIKENLPATGKFSDTNVEAGVTYVYSIRAYSADGGQSPCTSSNYGSTKPLKPVIASPLQPMIGTAGEELTISINAQGKQLAYQWYKNGKKFGPYWSNNWYTFTPTAADNGATFKCVVSNISGKATSNEVTLTLR